MTAKWEMERRYQIQAYIKGKGWDDQASHERSLGAATRLAEEMNKNSPGYNIRIVELNVYAMRDCDDI